jgi:hypothetical protein
VRQPTNRCGEIPSSLHSWEVLSDGQPSLCANLPEASRPNSIAYNDGWLYVADSFPALIWHVHSDDQSLVEFWTDHLLLQHLSGTPAVVLGPNAPRDFQTRSTYPSRTMDTLWLSPLTRMDRLTPAAYTSRSGATISPST